MSKRMSQPAAPASTIVTEVSSWNSVAWESEGGSGRYIRSAILKTSQPKPAKLKPQRTMTAIIASTPAFYRMITTLLHESK
jgi:hypothetical protein